MLQIFKDKDAEQGFRNLSEDYYAIMAAMNDTHTRLSERALDTLFDDLHDAMFLCLTDEASKAVHAMLEDEDSGASDVEDGVRILEAHAKIPHYLIEAYTGYYEDEMAADLESPMEEPEHVRAWVVKKIMNHTPREQLAIYLEWNGILGYTDCIWRIAVGGE